MAGLQPNIRASKAGARARDARAASRCQLSPAHAPTEEEENRLSENSGPWNHVAVPCVDEEDEK